LVVVEVGIAVLRFLLELDKTGAVGKKVIDKVRRWGGTSRWES